MHVAFLYASKAFDRVNRRKLLLKLESRGVPTYILRLLSNELIGQYICVRWGSTHSEFFPIGNGVKQGGILSPILCNVYMDDLSLQLHRQPIGCSVGGTVVNHMLYADDIVLFAPSAKGLQKLLDLSHTYGCNHDIEFNPLKSSVMYIDSRKAGYAQSMTIGGKTLNTVTSFSYLGHIICNDLMKAKCTPRVTHCVRNFTCVPPLSRSSSSQLTSVMFTCVPCGWTIEKQLFINL